MRPPLNRLSATQLVRMIASREVTCEAVTHSFVDAIEQRESDVRAFAWIDAKRALGIARRFDRSTKFGPLAGLPVAVKDVIDTAGITTEWLADLRTPCAERRRRLCHGDALGRRLRAWQDGDGGTRQLHTGRDSQSAPVGTHARRIVERIGRGRRFAHGAVCARYADSRLGDSAGVICGVVGVVPTRGFVPRSGVLPLSDTLDVVGCFANSVEDAALLAAAIALRTDWRDVDRAGPPAIAWTDTPWAARLSSTMLEALDSVVRVCADGGAAIHKIDWPVRFTLLADAQRTVQVFETARALAAEFDYRRSQLSPLLAALIEEGKRSTRTRIWPRCRPVATAQHRSMNCSAKPMSW